MTAKEYYFVNHWAIRIIVELLDGVPEPWPSVRTGVFEAKARQKLFEDENVTFFYPQNRCLTTFSPQDLNCIWSNPSFWNRSNHSPISESPSNQTVKITHAVRSWFRGITTQFLEDPQTWRLRIGRGSVLLGCDLIGNFGVRIWSKCVASIISKQMVIGGIYSMHQAWILLFEKKLR